MKLVLKQCEVKRTGCAIALVAAWIQPYVKWLKTLRGSNAVSTGLRRNGWIDRLRAARPCPANGIWIAPNTSQKLYSIGALLSYYRPSVSPVP
jgi:hypothetical protein